MAKRVIVTARTKKAQQRARLLKRKLVVGEAMIKDREAFQRVLDSQAPEPSSSTTIHREQGLTGFNWMKFSIGDTVVHKDDPNNIEFKIVGFYIKSDATVYYCKAERRKTLRFYAGQLLSVDKERSANTQPKHVGAGVARLQEVSTAQIADMDAVTEIIRSMLDDDEL